jgi:aspartate ammonia-lyase
MFIVDALQGGAGTSTNMNVNEVIANLALTILGESPGRYDIIHPLDDVNRGQSTNDVYPTALRIAAIELLRELSGACAALQEALQRKEQEFQDIPKLGRTELMDAVPVTLGAEFGAYRLCPGRRPGPVAALQDRGTAPAGKPGRRGGGSFSGPLSRKYRFTVIEELRDRNRDLFSRTFHIQNRRQQVKKFCPQITLILTE